MAVVLCNNFLAMRVHGPTAGVGGPPECTTATPFSPSDGVRSSVELQLPFLSVVPDLFYGCEPPARGPNLLLLAAGLGPQCSSGALGLRVDQVQCHLRCGSHNDDKRQPG